MEYWCRPPADFVADLSGAGIDHCLSTPQLNLRHGSYRNWFSDVLVFGSHHFHGILGRDCWIHCQEIDVIRERVDTHILYHPGRDAPIPQIYRTQKGYRVRANGVIPEKLDGTLYFGTPIEPDNWGMWLLQAIPNAADFLSDGQGERFLCYMGNPWQRRMLHAVGIPDEKLVPQELGYTYHCNGLVLRQFSRIDLMPTPLELEALARVAGELAGVAKLRASRRLFLSRRSITRKSEGKYRALQNEDALVEAFAERGYEIVEPELLAFPEQIRLFAEAELVVGLGGAGLFNLVFSPPATRVISIESSAAFVHDHAALFAALGHPFAFIFGRQDPEDETPIQKRWTIDVEGVMQAVSQYE